MPSSLTYPGVYVEEIPSGVRTIVGVATSITAFVGRTAKGPTNKAVTINSFSDFERVFGGLSLDSTMSYAVRDFYLNGGSQAVIVRLYRAATAAGSVSKAEVALGSLQLEAASEGNWSANLRATIDLDNIVEAAPTRFNLTIRDSSPGGASERFLNLTSQVGPRQVSEILRAESGLVRWKAGTPNLNAIHTKMEALQTLRAATPADPTAIATAEDELWAVTQDNLTMLESKYVRAKKMFEGKQNSGAPEAEVTTAKTAADTAKGALEAARQALKTNVSDGQELTIGEFLPAQGEVNKQGLHALEQVDLFNLLCIPPYKSSSADVDVNLVSTAAAYCEKRRAMLIVDAPSAWIDKSKAKEEFTALEDKIGTRSRNAALYFPRLKQANPLRGNLVEEFVPCGAVAGLFARTDVQRGVWKAPAGTEATLVGVSQLSVNLTDAENGELNPLGINCLRAFPLAGRVVWGARTLRGADGLADEYKYVPVRRTALYIEESLYRGTQWAVFEPNDEPLWAQLRLNIGSFMHDLFRQGAFQGSSPREAYLVKCDKETTTQSDINKGIVNVVVGFAPLKPAEFVVIKLQQLAGQIET